MIRRHAIWASWVLTAACTPGGELPDLLDTGWFEDEDAPVCRARVEETVPADGAVDWYWRDALTAFVSEADGAYTLRLTDVGGAEVPVTLTEDDSGLVRTLTPVDGLPPSTTFTLQIDDCNGPREVSFTTSDLGRPLADGARSLSGRTWQLDLEDATWVEPGGFSNILSTLPYNPILVGIAFVDDRNLDWIGGQGNVALDGIIQDPLEPTWNFPLTPFDDSPYFATSADEVRFVIQGSALVIHDFELTGTFSADGRRIGGGTLEGLGDTRDLGNAIGQGSNDRAICDFAETLGVDCVACPDGRPLCLEVVVQDLEGVELPDLSLVPVQP